VNRASYLRKELGQTTVHYAGVGLLAITLIALVLASTTTDIGQRVICTINSAVSQVGGGPSLSCGSTATTPDLQVQPAKAKSDSKEPDSCTTSTKTTHSGGHVKIGFVKFGSSFALAEQEEKYADTFVNTLCRHADTILFSAAHVGQGGDGHINEQPIDYWIEKFKKNNQYDLCYKIFLEETKNESYSNKEYYLRELSGKESAEEIVTIIRNRKSLEKMENNNNRSGFGAGFLLGRWTK